MEVQDTRFYSALAKSDSYFDKTCMHTHIHNKVEELAALDVQLLLLNVELRMMNNISNIGGTEVYPEILFFFVFP